MRINKILVVDDDPISNHITKDAIHSIYFAEEVVVKTDGLQAIKYLKEECKSSGSYPELILLDLKMPSMDGFEFLKEFETTCYEFSKEIVVAILTISKDGEDIIRLRKLGNYYLLHKPITSDMLIDIYHRYFRNRNQQVG